MFQTQFISLSWWPTSTINMLSIYYKLGKVLLQIGAALFYCELGQVLLQIGAA